MTDDSKDTEVFDINSWLRRGRGRPAPEPDANDADDIDEDMNSRIRCAAGRRPNPPNDGNTAA